jgi:hypothetical protein
MADRVGKSCATIFGFPVVPDVKYRSEVSAFGVGSSGRINVGAWAIPELKSDHPSGTSGPTDIFLHHRWRLAHGQIDLFQHIGLAYGHKWLLYWLHCCGK